MVGVKKNHYMTKCERCNAKFVFDDSNIEVIDDNKLVTCPSCDNTILEYETRYECYTSRFKKISQWRYNRILKKYGYDIKRMKGLK